MGQRARKPAPAAGVSLTRRIAAGVALVVAGCLVSAPPARAEAPLEARYAAWATGLNIMDIAMEFRPGPEAYRVALSLRTAGLLSFFLRGEQVSVAEGSVRADGRLEPARFRMEGTWWGRARRLALDYEGATPVVRAVVPPNGDEREEVPEAMRAGTVDTLTALAILATRIDRTGGCDGTLATYDGRRRVDVSARTVGEETLTATTTAPFGGRTLRCTFEAVQAAGFWHDQDRIGAREPQRGTAWFATVVPGTVPIPVRVEAGSRWLGPTFLYLQEARAAMPARVAVTGGKPF